MDSGYKKEKTSGPIKKTKRLNPYPISVLHRLAGFVGWLYLHLVGKTSIVQHLDNPQALNLRRKKKSGVYAFWHNTQVFLSYIHRGEPKAAVVVSQSKDGEYIAQVMKWMGLDAIRGSSSRGGGVALLEVINNLKDGWRVGFTPDGPRGPVYKVQPGVVKAAQETKLPVIPMSNFPRRRLVFNSWDKFFIPLPFGHVVTGHGKPILIDSAEPMEQAARKVEEGLNQVKHDIEQAASEAPSWVSSVVGWGLHRLYSLLSVLLAPVWFAFLFLKFGFKRSLRGLKDRFGHGHIPNFSQDPIWFHAASLGEWQALKPLIHEFEGKNKKEIFVTVSTPEAKEVIKKDVPHIPVALLPLDYPWILNRWIKRLHPQMFVLVETELWPNLISALNRALVPIFIVNGRLSKRSSSRWRLFRPFTWLMMSKLSFVYARTSADAARYCQMGVPSSKIEITGNMKTDNLTVLDPGQKEKRRRALFGDTEGTFVVGGSTWDGEEALLLKIIEKHKKDSVRLILAPRRLERVKKIESLMESMACSWSRWSKVKTTNQWSTDVLVVDTLGDLKDMYAACDIAFIGGSVAKRGGQNPLEPASAQLALVYGPSMENFSAEETHLNKAGASRQGRHEADVLSDLSELIKDKDRRQNLGERAAGAVGALQGSAKKTFGYLAEQMGWHV